MLPFLFLTKFTEVKMIDYTKYVKIEDLRKRGYNLEQEGVLDISHFDTLKDAVDDFMLNACNIVFNLIKSYRGRLWTNAFFEDMAKDNLTGKALEYKKALHNAIIEQAIFTYDNGDSQATSKNEDRKYNTAHAPKAAAELWDLVLCW